MAMPSELQRRKIAQVFHAMDVDGDGFLEQSDFEALTARWTTNRGLAPDSADRIRLTTIMMGWWETLLAASDLNRDNKVTMDEVLLVVDRLGDQEDAVTATASAMFDAIDENGDGSISAGEYRRLIETWSGQPTNTDDIFPLLDRDGDGGLSREEFIVHWKEFWAGDDSSAPGAWLFGRFELPELDSN
jgi:Ca2+-binding EF-hand superfamily protein